MLETDLAQMIEQDHQALDALVTGDPEPKKRMFSRRDDVTLANPPGPPVRGWSDVEKTMERVASSIRDGEPHHFERISESATPDLACVLEIERSRAKFGGSNELAAYSLRVDALETRSWRVEGRLSSR